MPRRPRNATPLPVGERRTTRTKRGPHQPPAAPVLLPKARLSETGSLADAIRHRQTIREISAETVGPQILSNVLFAACGVNRRRGPVGSRGVTAASASNSQEIVVYVALAGGVYAFDPERHELAVVLCEDVRLLALGPRQPNASPEAPVQLIYVVDLAKLEHTSGFEEPGLHDPEIQKSYYFVDTGMIAANVYLYAASEGLACWFHNCDTVSLASKLRLRKDQHVLFAQTVGFPASRSSSRALRQRDRERSVAKRV